MRIGGVSFDPAMARATIGSSGRSGRGDSSRRTDAPYEDQPDYRQGSDCRRRSRPCPPRRSPPAPFVDLELVLAVDISRSMDFDELRLQRQGYVEALRHPAGDPGDRDRTERPDRDHLCRVGRHRRIRPSSCPGRWCRTRPRRRLSPTRVGAAPVGRERGTSISQGLAFAAGLFASSGVERAPAGDRHFRRRTQQYRPAGRGDARSRRRRRHHHQRPADLLKSVERFRSLQHSRSRHLLRRLRHRRAGRLRHHRRRSQPFRAGDPAQARARDCRCPSRDRRSRRRLHAGAAGRLPGRREGPQPVVPELRPSRFSAAGCSPPGSFPLPCR